MDTRVRNLVLFVTLVIGLIFVGYYTYYLRRQEMRSWRQIKVAFPDVGGLKEKSAVMINGAAMGRVRSVSMFENRQLVVLDIEPLLILHTDFKAEIVPTSALGFVGVQVKPGSLDAPVLPDDSEVVYEGTIRDDLGGAPPTPGRRKELQRQMEDWARWADGLKNPDSGIVGRLVFDRQRRVEVAEALAALEQTWVDVDEGLLNLETGTTNLTSDDALDAMMGTATALNETFTGTRDSLREVLRGERGGSPFLADRGFAHAWKRALVRQEKNFQEIAQGEGTLGRLVKQDALYVSLANATADLNEETAAGRRGEGTFGLFSSPEVGEEVRGTFENLSTGLDNFERSPAVNSASAKRDVEDLFGDVDDALGNLRRGLKGLRRGLPDRKFQGVLFSVF